VRESVPTKEGLRPATLAAFAVFVTFGERISSNKRRIATVAAAATLAAFAA